MRRLSAMLSALVILAGLITAGTGGAFAAETKKQIPSPDEFVEVEKMPEVLLKVTPVYPDEAREKGLQGSVRVKALVDTDGKVADVKLAESSGVKMLDKSALKAALKTTYTPALQDGHPVAVWVEYKIRFALSGGDLASMYPGPDEFVPVETMPEMIHEEAPVYPPEARKKGIEGKVYVKSLIDSDGIPVKVIIAKSSGTPSLDKAAKVAAKKNLYKPAMQNEKPVAVWVTYAVTFDLQEK